MSRVLARSVKSPGFEPISFTLNLFGYSVCNWSNNITDLSAPGV